MASLVELFSLCLPAACGGIGPPAAGRPSGCSALAGARFFAQVVGGFAL